MTSPVLRRGARAAFTVNALLAWGGFLLMITLTGLDQYAHTPGDPHMLGHNPDGARGAASRIFDELTYFTVWSNIVVALDALLLACHPERDARWRRVLRLDALMMIVVTAIVYALVLAPAAHPTGWERVTNPVEHILVPAVTVLVWFVWGPRGRTHLRELPGALVVPVVWIVMMLVRGAVIHAYPYGFVDVISYGYVHVLLVIAGILVFGLVIGLLLWVFDRQLSRGAQLSSKKAVGQQKTG